MLYCPCCVEDSAQRDACRHTASLEYCLYYIILYITRLHTACLACLAAQLTAVCCPMAHTPRCSPAPLRHTIGSTATIVYYTICYTILYYTMLYYTAPCDTKGSNAIILYCTVLYCTIYYSIYPALYYTILSTILSYPILYYNYIYNYTILRITQCHTIGSALNCIALPCLIWCCIIRYVKRRRGATHCAPIVPRRAVYHAPIKSVIYAVCYIRFRGRVIYLYNISTTLFYTIPL